jgi:hypothetical protein
MRGHDTEIERLRTEVNCAVLLEQFPPPWQLDRAESTKNCLKYRRGQGEVLIVSHGGRGWWDPQSDAKGDVFDLVQYLEPGLNFGEVRKVLRPFAGINPAAPEDLGTKHRPRKAPSLLPMPERWARRPRLRRGSTVWRYLAQARALPTNVLEAARAADILREGPYGNAWFAHHDDTGAVTHIEIRGPDYKGSITGGEKILFRLPGGAPPLRRLVLAEAPIDALSLAALEDIRPDTLYAATGGGMGPATIHAIEQILTKMAVLRRAEDQEIVLSIGTDANPAGERYATRHEELAGHAGVPFERLRPSIADGDWNDVLKAGRVSA